MKEIKKRIDSLSADAEDCTLIGDLAIKDEREHSLTALAERLRELAAELEKLAVHKIFADRTVRPQDNPCDREWRPKS
jgi:chaperonin cofactor prefoldin